MIRQPSDRLSGQLDDVVAVAVVVVVVVHLVKQPKKQVDFNFGAFLFRETA
jgi:hypothetical protein